MALADTVFPAVQPSFVTELNFPAGVQCDWAVLCDAPDALDNDTGVIVGGKVVKPGAITRAAQRLYHVSAQGTSLLVALKYNADVGTPTDPVVRVFGRDRNGWWHVLRDSSGASELTIDVDTALDTLSTDATHKITEPVEVDLDGSVDVIVAVQTAFAASSGTVNDSALIAKLKNNR